MCACAPGDLGGPLAHRDLLRTGQYRVNRCTTVLLPVTAATPHRTAFQAFQNGIRERCAEPPLVREATIVGNYRMLEHDGETPASRKEQAA